MTRTAHPAAPVVIAPDSFKGTATARAVAEALAEGWRSVDRGARLETRPMADGGEGTLAAFADSIPQARSMPIEVTGAEGSPIRTDWLLLPPSPDAPGGTGVVELAATCGIEQLAARDLRPMDAGTEGFGQAIAAALDHGVSRLLLGIGGSASTDGGAGMLTALGARILDAAGEPIRAGARGLAGAASVDLSALRRPPERGALVITDVTSPLFGPEGAAAVFGPQKGASSAQVEEMDAALAGWANLVGADPLAPGAGAAGGAGYALGVWGATLTAGAPEIARAIGLAEIIADARLVVTGEGSYDGQSGAGKAPWYVARLAAAAGVPVVMVAGRITAETGTDFAAAISLTDRAGSPADAMADPQRWLMAAGAELATRWG